MPSATDVRDQINAAITKLKAELKKTTSQEAKQALGQSLKDLLRLRSDVARAEIKSNSAALRALKQKLDDAVARARASQLSNTAGKLSTIVENVSEIVETTTGGGAETASGDDDRLTVAPQVEGLPPPETDAPDEDAPASATEANWYADEREVLFSSTTATLDEPPPPSDPTDEAHWAADGWSADYGHLGRPASSDPFRFAAKDLDLLCTLNTFDVTSGQDEVLFGLRGCLVTGATGGSFREEVLLREATPDHEEFRCVIGVWKRSTNQLAVFTGSTVPNPGGMRKQMTFGESENCCNLLQTGRYRYAVGNHKVVPNAFRQLEEVVVLRSHDDLMYETTDFWDRCFPGDNIHPSWTSATAKFSSFGCQTVSGAYTADDGHSGEWATFRSLAGVKGDGADQVGRRYIYVLLTGREAHYARFLNDSGKAGDPVETAALRRLRFGSGIGGSDALQAPVKALQQALNIKDDGDFGPGTALAVIAWQRDKLGRADGIVTPLTATGIGAALGPAAAADVFDPSTLGPLTRTSDDPLPPAPGMAVASGARVDPDTLNISDQAVLTFMLGNESFYAYQYFMVEGDTIGYGHLINDQDGNRFRDGLTEDEAFDLFLEDMRFFVGRIRKSIEVPITQAQFDALASLTANVGHVPKTLKALINAEDFAAAAEQFKRYVKNNDGEVLGGLVRRRGMESNLFLTGIYPKASLSGAGLVSRAELRDRQLRQIERLFPDGLGEPHGSVTTDNQRNQAKQAYRRMTGRDL